MKDQIKIQSTSDKFQQEALFIGDQMQSQDNANSSSFKNNDNLKRTLPSSMQKKINPRLLIL
ncbi:hypothetical protein SAMN06265348_11470 [Pedobacter westerhofensis]|uniref:Uncharacterized protein n=1 Tax=Pedobacter westerhofensis TaxID=425512 RepID=A0A521FMT9_9SPHI|nr:hypothetical protein [Pedobacter westerhofensis]SMO97498.1 hypothetical protein SAMN06265348_11470 [Pedobacter westerhofensis]